MAIYNGKIEVVFVKNTTNTQTSTSHPGLYVEIDNSRKLKTKLYHKRDDFTILTVNFPFIRSNFPAKQAYGIYISQHVRYCRACAKYSDFLDRDQMTTEKLLKQSYRRHHELVERYKVSISKMAMYLSPFTYIFLSFTINKTFYRTLIYE